MREPGYQHIYTWRGKEECRGGCLSNLQAYLKEMRTLLSTYLFFKEMEGGKEAKKDEGIQECDDLRIC